MTEAERIEFKRAELRRAQMLGFELAVDSDVLAEAISAFVTDLTGVPFRTDADEVTRFLLLRISGDGSR